MNSELYHVRKAMGLCVYCGAVKKDDGHSYCPACREEQSRKRVETRKYLNRIGVCPYCGKARLYAGEKRCPACAEKGSERTREKWIKNKDYFKRQCRSRYDRLKEAGLCTRCGRKNTTGRVRCPRCRAKDRQRKHEKWIETHYPPRNERADYGLCFFCGKPIDEEGYKACSACREAMREGRRKAREAARKRREDGN